MDWTSLRLRRFSLLFGGIFLLLSALNLYRLAAVEKGIWWTPAGRAQPLAETREAFELRIGGIPMEDLLRARALRIASPGGEAVLNEASVRVRLNHEHEVLAGRTPAIIASAAAAGAALVVLLLGIALSLPRRPAP